jgi:ABC-type nitrate/sulfonate/bicarbonate transport system permease component
MTSLVATGDAERIDPIEIERFYRRHASSSNGPEIWWKLGLILEVIVILGSWQVLVGVVEVVPPAFFPPPSAIAESLVELFSSRSFLGHLWFSTSNVLIGVAVAALVGIVVGLGVGWSRLLLLTVAPLLWLLYSTPKVVLAPLIVLGLGLGPPSKIALVILLGVFPIALNTIEGVRTVDPSLLQAARVFGVRGVALARKLILPATFPFVLVGLRRAVALGFIGEILGEFLGGSKGLGHLLERAAVGFHMDDSLAVVVIMVLAANVGLVAVEVARRRIAPWHRDAPTQLW